MGVKKGIQKFILTAEDRKDVAHEGQTKKGEDVQGGAESKSIGGRSSSSRVEKTKGGIMEVLFGKEKHRTLSRCTEKGEKKGKERREKLLEFKKMGKRGGTKKGPVVKRQSAQ